MGLSATSRSVALQYFSSYPLQRAHKPLTAKGRCATDSDVAPVPTAPLARVTVLRHCRCIDCLNLSNVAGEYFCSELIGGTKARWSDGNRQCDPPPDAWHYCARYRGPQVSKGVLVWPKATPRAAQVGAGSTISADPADPTAVNEKRDTTQPCVNGSFPASYDEDRGGNSRADSLCLLAIANTP